MSLFATPDFALGEVASDGGSKKRKRPSASGPKSAADNEAPSINIEKLLKKYHSLEKAASPKAADGKPKKVKPQRKITSEASLAKVIAQREASQAEDAAKPVEAKQGRQPAPGQGEGKRNKKRRKAAEALAAEEAASQNALPVGSEEKQDASMTVEEDVVEAPSTAIVTPALSNPHLTELQQKMKSKLGGARFRQINEQLVGPVCRFSVLE